MAEIIQMGGITTVDIPVNKVLEAAKDRLDTVVVIGYNEVTGYYFASSTSDGTEMLWLIEKCKLRLLDQGE